MQNACQPLYQEGRNVTGRAKTAVTGKRFVAITGNGTEGVPDCGHATAAGRVFGVAGYDAAIGEAFPVFRKGVVPVKTSGAVTAFAEVEVGATGLAVAKTAGVAVGYAMFDAAAGADAFICLYE